MVNSLSPQSSLPQAFLHGARRTQPSLAPPANDKRSESLSEGSPKSVPKGLPKGRDDSRDFEVEMTEMAWLAQAQMPSQSNFGNLLGLSESNSKPASNQKNESLQPNQVLTGMTDSQSNPSSKETPVQVATRPLQSVVDDNLKLKNLLASLDLSQSSSGVSQGFNSKKMGSLLSAERPQLASQLREDQEMDLNFRSTPFNPLNPNEMDGLFESAKAPPSGLAAGESSDPLFQDFNEKNYLKPQTNSHSNMTWMQNSSVQIQGNDPAPGKALGGSLSGADFLAMKGALVGKNGPGTSGALLKGAMSKGRESQLGLGLSAGMLRGSLPQELNEDQIDLGLDGTQGEMSLAKNSRSARERDPLMKSRQVPGSGLKMDPITGLLNDQIGGAVNGSQNLGAFNNSNPQVEISANVVPGAMSKGRLSTDGLMNMSTGIQRMSMQGGGEMHIRLKPDNLGELHVKVVTQGQGVGLQIHASDEQSKKIIEESLSHLKESMSAQNLILNSVDLSVVGGEKMNADLNSGFWQGSDGSQVKNQDSNLNMNQNPNLNHQQRRDQWGSENDSGGLRRPSIASGASLRSPTFLSSGSGLLNNRLALNSFETPSRLDVLA